MSREQIINIEFYKNDNIKGLEMNFESVGKELKPKYLLQIATDLLPTLCKELLSKTADLMDLKGRGKEEFISDFTKILYANALGNGNSKVVHSKAELDSLLKGKPWEVWPRKTL